MRGFDNLGGHGDILFEGQGGAVEHQGREADVQALQVLQVARPMIEMEHDGDARFFGDGGDHGGGHLQAGVLDGPLAHLQDYRGSLLFGRLDDGLHTLHVVGVKRADRVAAALRILQQLLRRNQGHQQLLSA